MKLPFQSRAVSLRTPYERSCGQLGPGINPSKHVHSVNSIATTPLSSTTATAFMCPCQGKNPGDANGWAICEAMSCAWDDTGKTDLCLCTP
jgi:hypothetical protein